MALAALAMPAAACGGAEFEIGDPIGADGAVDASVTDGAGGRGGAAGSGGTGTGGGGPRDDAHLDFGGAGATGADSQADGWVADGPRDTSSDMLVDGPRLDGDARGQDVVDASVEPPTGIDGGMTDGADGGLADQSEERDSSAPADSIDERPIVDANCGEPITYYHDLDSDGFGVNSDTLLSCTLPGKEWSTAGADCRDDLEAVNPGVMGYFGSGYVATGKPQDVSFDYDCSGLEEPDPGNMYGPAPTCPGLLNCTGVGYVPVNPSRTGMGIDPRCGSTTLSRCTGTLTCTSVLEPAPTPYRCH